MLVVFCKQKMSYELRISDWSSDVCSSDLNARFRCRIRSPKRSSPNTPPTRRRLRQRPERRTLIGADTAMVRPLGFLVGLGFITALVLAILTTPLSNEPNVAHEFHKHPKNLKLASEGILLPHWDQIGRASCGERVCKYVKSPVVAGSI